MFVRESVGERSLFGVGISLLESKWNATAERKPHPSWGWLSVVRTTAAPEMEEVGFCTKNPVTLLPMSQSGWVGGGCRTCQPQANIPVSLRRLLVMAVWKSGLKTPDHTNLTQLYAVKGSCAGVNTHLSAPPSFPGCLVT